MLTVTSTQSHNITRECAPTGQAILSQQKNKYAIYTTCLPTVNYHKQNNKSKLHTSDDVDNEDAASNLLSPRLLITNIYTGKRTELIGPVE